MSDNIKNKVPGAGAVIFPKKFVSKPSYKGVIMVDISIAYPQVEVASKPRVSQRISTFYRENAKKYYNYASHILYEQAVGEFLDSQKRHFPFRPFSVTEVFETPYNRGELLSIYRDRYEYTGGAHGNTVRLADTWHLGDGLRLPLGAFFEDSGYKSTIFAYITENIKQQIESGSGYYFDDYVKNVFRYFDERNYYLTYDGFAIYFPLYTIAAYAQGIPVFVIPYEAFGGSLKHIE